MVSHQIADDSPITQLLRRWEAGDALAREELFETAYRQIRAIAKNAVRAAPGATLSPTELAHECVLRLLGATPQWQDRRHFFRVVAQATRQVLVDAARHRLRDKRGNGQRPVSLSHADQVAIEDDEELLRLHEAMSELIKTDPRRGQVLELTYFAGLDRDEIARTLDVSVPTVDRDLRFGKAWLKRGLAA